MRQSIKKQVKKAFTLVEILIVVVILGILAAIVIPQFASATRDSQGANISTQLSTLQKQIELFMNKNNNRSPFVDQGSAAWSGANLGGWHFLMGDMNADGDNIDAGEQDLALVSEPPANPAWQGTAGDEILVDDATTGTGSSTVAWLWRTDIRRLHASYYNETTNRVTDTATD